VSGFHIEDQIQQKRCGHLSNKRLVSVEIFTSRIRAAVAARKALNSDIVIIARTDALSASAPGEGGEDQSYGAALDRLKAARDAGADVAFLEGVDSVEAMKKVVADLAPWPVLLNMVEYGRTPTISVQEAKEIGFRMVIWPFAGVSPAVLAMRAAYKELRETGLAKSVAPVTPKDIFELCGLKEWVAIDTAAGGEDFRNGV
jgi:2-methylisocitrate lyase-like PEP mutase family enzyme